MTNILLKDEWTLEQIEVWQNVETYTSLILKGNVKEFLKFFDKNYTGWNNYEPMPINKTDIKNELCTFPKREVISYLITPLAITVFNNVAIVHYYYSVVYKNSHKKNKEKLGRNTDILLKQKGKWILIGDHTEIVNN